MSTYWNQRPMLIRVRGSGTSRMTISYKICNWKECKGTEEIVSVLMSPPSYIVCKKGPLKCAKNASFLIDTRSLKHPTDWKSGDLDLSATWDASA